jgi:SAM-dependent methyltransferase
MTSQTFDFSSQQQLVVDYFTRNFVKDPSAFIPFIDRRCQMYSSGIAKPDADPGAPFTYFDSALKMLHPLKSLGDWRFGGLSKANRILDFASGFGRLTRFLVQEVRPSALVVADIQREAVEFQQRTFGVDGFVSTTEPTELRSPHSFDCIFVGSLFTHLPEHRFHGWLARLMELLTPRGMLVFSVHDESLLARHRPMASRGFDFNPNVSEIGSLERYEYGSTHVSAEFVGRAIEEASGGIGSYHRIPRGLWHHDLYIYTKDESAGAAQPGVGILIPQDIVSLQGDRLPLWFSETDKGHRIERVELLCHGHSIAAADSSTGVFVSGDGRFQPNGWAPAVYVIFTPVSRHVFENDLVVRVLSSSGQSRLMPIWDASIRAVGSPLGGGREEDGLAQDHLSRVECELEEARAVLESHRATLQRRDAELDAIRSSLVFRTLTAYWDIKDHVLPRGTGVRRIFDRFAAWLKA